MKVLFVTSGNRANKPGIVVYNQAQSLKYEGIDISFFQVKGKGILGYLKNVLPLTRYLRTHPDIELIHSHYSFSAFVTTIALIISKPVPHVVSLMGSDTKKKGLLAGFIKLFNNHFWNNTIVKNSTMLLELGKGKAELIPNGVDIKEIIALEDARNKTNKINSGRLKNTILFVADPFRSEKNFELARRSVSLINIPVNLKVINNVDHINVLKEMLASDILLLTSLWEGSPNVIKEAMACNCPVVATNVGDICWLFGDEPGHYLTTFDPDDVAEKITQALEFAKKDGRTNGRNRIFYLGLESRKVAKRIIEVYKKAILQG